jgi:hypothetical protein
VASATPLETPSVDRDYFVKPSALR